jgi:hypothetical protein
VFIRTELLLFYINVVWLDRLFERFIIEYSTAQLDEFYRINVIWVIRYVKEEKSTQGLDLSVEGRIILKWMLQKEDMGCEMDFSGL